ncbi:MAG: 5-(carboxyamino)imidazole ribonucleotide mutase [Alphaproteobacteria bacterium]
MSEAAPVVSIVMGSQSDWDVMRHARDTLQELGVVCEAKVISAHRTPDRLAGYVRELRERGVKVVIAGAGMSAALPGAIAALTTLPVLGVPLEGKAFGGMDSLLSMVQMPRGVPVGTLAVGKAGAVNAALLAAAVLALSDQALAAALDDFRARQTAAVAEEPEG